jgi:hypothetical protein
MRAGCRRTARDGPFSDPARGRVRGRLWRPRLTRDRTAAACRGSWGRSRPRAASRTRPRCRPRVLFGTRRGHTHGPSPGPWRGRADGRGAIPWSRSRFDARRDGVRSRETLRGRVGLTLEQRSDPFQHVRGDLPTTALRAEDLLQLPLEVGVPAAGVAATQVSLDLDAQRTDELTVEVELDLLQHVLTLSR